MKKPLLRAALLLAFIFSTVFTMTKAQAERRKAEYIKLQGVVLTSASGIVRIHAGSVFLEVLATTEDYVIIKFHDIEDREVETSVVQNGRLPASLVQSDIKKVSISAL